MRRLEKLKVLGFRKDMASKLALYSNVNQISLIRYINLNFSGLKTKSSVILGLGFLYLLGGRRGRLILSSSLNFTKSLGCNLKLKGVEAFYFLQKFLDFNLVNILDFEEGFSRFSFSDAGSFSFIVRDIYVFSEFSENLFKFRNLKNLNISIIFSSNNKDENVLLLQSLGFLFKFN